MYCIQLGESTGVVRVCKKMQNPTWYNNHVHGCCNIAVQSCYFIIPWQHVLSCMNMAVDLSRWFQQHCSSLFVHQAMDSLFQHAWTSLSTTMFKLAISTMFKSINKLCVFTCVAQFRIGKYGLKSTATVKRFCCVNFQKYIKRKKKRYTIMHTCVYWLKSSLCIQRGCGG